MDYSNYLPDWSMDKNNPAYSKDEPEQEIKPCDFCTNGRIPFEQDVMDEQEDVDPKANTIECFYCK